MTYVTYEEKKPDGSIKYRLERRTGRGNKGNAKYKELQRLEREWKKQHEKTD